MFDKFQKIAELKKMRDQAMQIQRELDGEVIEVEKHGVVVQISLAQKVRSIAINGKTESDVVDTINEAIKKSQEQAAKRMQGMMGGMDAFKGLLGS
jgi:DNA-binding protein YbaB